MSNIIPIRPSLALNFNRNQYRDDLITCVRSGTATRVNEFGLIESVAANQPRIDYDPSTGECLGLLCEESRTNLLLWSQEFQRANWSLSNINALQNTTLAPDGTLTADTLSTAAAGACFGIQGVTATSTSHTYSIFLKQGTRNSCQLFFRNNTTATNFFNFAFNFATPFSGLPANVRVSSFPNGWYKVSMTQTTGISIGNTLWCYPGTSITAAAAGETWIVWGASLEAGDNATSYIKTEASTVTRSADNYSLASLGSLIKPGQGSFMAAIRKRSAVAGTVFELRNAGGTNIIKGSHDSSNNAKLDVTNASSAVAALSAAAGTTDYKAAYNYILNAMKLSADAGTVQEDLSGTIGEDHSILYLGRTASGDHLNGHLKQLVYRPFPVTNGQLQILSRRAQLAV